MTDIFSILGWGFYILLLTITLVRAVYAFWRKEKLISSLFSAGLLLLLPLTLLLFLMPRPIGTPVILYFWEHIWTGSWNALYLLFLHFYLLFWWIHISSRK